jgi:tetratricopeptide (TPR) repeat protein
MTTAPPDSATTDVIARARAALDRYDGKEALAALGTLGDRASDPEVLACLIEAHALQRDFAAAEAAIERACALHPQAPQVLEAAGIAALHARNYPLAEQRFSAAVRLDAGYATAHNNLGVVYEYLNREADAASAYARAIEQNPALSPGYKNLGRIAEGHGDLERARTFYEQGRARTPAAGEFGRLLAGLGSNYADVRATLAADAGSPEHFLATEIGLVAQAHLPPGRKPAVLDLICGPGTVCAMLWRDAGLMIGIDPRVPLLQAAQAQNIYFDLKDQYPTDYLRTCKRGATDLITSNCGFSNKGDLLPVFLDLHVVLAPRGLLVMAYATQSDVLGYYIEGNGAFSHDPRYVLERADFESLILKERRDYEPATHPQVDRTYTLMAFAKPE